MAITKNALPVPPKIPSTQKKGEQRTWTKAFPLITSAKATPAPVKYYLVAFNIISALGWAYVFILIVTHILNLDGKSSIASPATTKTASSTLSRFFSSLPIFRTSGTTASLETRIPTFLQPLYRRSTTTFTRIGWPTAFVQSLALLEVIHVLLGWVRSPLQTTAMQVSSRLILVWGITEQFADVRSNPLYTSMVFAWSTTEIIRYSFYACNLLGHEPRLLLYLRYTTFYVLYPLGASSEAFLIYATLPTSSPIPGWKSWYQGVWKPTDYFRGLLFLIWWPGLYVMYTYMIVQRRKVLKKTPTLRKRD